MGNEITKKYELPPDNNATAGLNSLWKIFPGIKLTKDLIKKDISVWILTKDSLGQRQPFPITDKNIIEQIFLIMRKDILTLKDLQHNGILKVIEVSYSSLSLFLSPTLTLSLTNPTLLSNPHSLTNPILLSLSLFLTHQLSNL